MKKSIQKLFSYGLCGLILIAWMLFGTIVVFGYSGNGGLIVHVTKTGDCYHNAGCSYLRSDIEMTLEDAYLAGYRPCSRCNPPEYTGDASSGAVHNNSNNYSDNYNNNNSNYSNGNNSNTGNHYNTTTSVSKTKSPVGLILGCVAGGGVVTSAVVGGARSSKRKRDELMRMYEAQKEENLRNQKYYDSVSDASKQLRYQYERKSKECERLTRQYEHQQKKYENIIKHYKEYYVVRNLHDIVDAPKSVEIKQDGTVTKGEVRYDKKYGDLTVFVSPSGKKYHKKRSCGSSYSKTQINIYDAILQGYSACKTCCSKEHDTEVPYWYKKIPEVLRDIKELDESNL